MTTDNYTKHTHKNPIQKLLISLFYTYVLKELKALQPDTILDVGCGEGFTLRKLKDAKIGKKLEGIEYLDRAIELGKKENPDITIKKGTIYTLPYKDNSFDVVVCTEVLEHLEEPEKALQELIRVSKKHILLTVPNEPFFMLAQFVRGKNWSRWGNDIEHINHWTIMRFKQLIARYLTIRSLRVPFFWILVVGEKNSKKKG